MKYGGGDPARFIRKRFDDDMIENLMNIQWWTWPDEEIEENAQYFNNPEGFLSHYRINKEKT